MRYLVIVTLLFMLSCTKSIRNDTGEGISVKEVLSGDENTFFISPNQAREIVFNNVSLTISFEDVVKDSRCGPDVTCVSAGSGVIKLEVGNSSELLDVMNKEYASSLIYTNINGDQYKIELFRLDPLVPFSQRPVIKSEYRAYFTIKKI